MRTLFSFCFISLFINVFSVTAQAPVCMTAAQFAADECADACIGCALNGYQGSNSNFTSSGGIYCGGTIIESNSVWHAFIASTSPVNISLLDNNCANGDGLQLVLFDGCGGTEIACNASFAGNAGAGKALNFAAIVGQTYYLMVNGYNGDVCNYQISITGAMLTPPVTTIGAVSGLNSVCPGALTTYSVPAVPNAIAYEWLVTPNGDINASGQNNAVIPAPGGNQIEVEFPVSGGNHQVKVRALGACGSTTSFVTKNVLVAPIPPTNLPPLILSPEDLPYEWPLDPSNTVTAPGGYLFTAYLVSYLGCDSIVAQWVYAKQHPYGRVYWDVNGNNNYNAAIDTPAEGINVTTSNNQSEFTDNDGIYQMGAMDAGNQITVPVLPQFATGIMPAVHIVSNNTDVYNFALKPQKAAASGRVYVDTDGNGSFNAGDSPLTGILVKIATGPQILTDANGLYQFTNVAHTEKITITVPNDYELVSAGSLEFTPDVNTGYDFILQPNNAFGQVWWDTDMNQVISAGDIPASGIRVVASSGAFVFSGNNGLFTFPGLIAGDTLRTDFHNLASIPSFQIIQAAAPSGGYQLLLLPDNVAFDLVTDFTSFTPFRPGFTGKAQITIKNESGAYIPNVGAGLKFPGNLIITSSTPTGILQSSDSMSWNLGSILPFGQKNLIVTFQVPASATLGSVLIFKAVAHPFTGDAFTPNNTDIANVTVVGAYDPNDKQVEPAYITPAGLVANQPFEYTIRFQNTGTYPAENVVIVDSLTPLLDWSSVRLVSSSHPCTWNISPQGVIAFHFEGIMLPDSVNNEPESHGFVKFSVLPLPGLLVGNAVENFCDIYFDFNAPVRTNTTQTQVVYFLPGTEIQNGNKLLSVRPNPASFGVKFSWPDLTAVNGTITLYDVNGSPVLVENLAAGVNYAFINTGFLPDGIYMAVLQAGNIFYTRRVTIMKEGPIRRGGE